MSAAKYNITVEQGATFTLSLLWKIADVAQNLTGYTARMQIREDYDSTVVQAAATSGAGDGIVLGGTAGTVNITLSATKTAAIAVHTGVYDVEVESPTGVVTRLVQGRVTVTPEVTR